MPQLEIFGYPFQYVLGVIFILIYAVVMGKDTLLSFLSKLQAGEILPTTDTIEPTPTTLEPKAVTVNSDKPAPKGTAEYIALVKSSAPDASDTLRLDYAQQELTEAQILRQEVTRKLPPVPATPAPKVRE
jgi:hypothetical protein